MTLSPRPLRFLALVVLGAALVACGRDQAAASNRGSGGGDAPVTVTTTVLQPREFADSIVAIGTARARGWIGDHSRFETAEHRCRGASGFSEARALELDLDWLAESPTFADGDGSAAVGARARHARPGQHLQTNRRALTD